MHLMKMQMHESLVCPEVLGSNPNVATFSLIFFQGCVRDQRDSTIPLQLGARTAMHTGKEDR
jgi:hypothetical protein